MKDLKNYDPIFYRMVLEKKIEYYKEGKLIILTKNFIKNMIIIYDSICYNENLDLALEFARLLRNVDMLDASDELKTHLYKIIDWYIEQLEQPKL